MFQIDVGTLLRISTVLVSLGVVSTPILYPRYSLFSRRSRNGVHRLQQVREEHDEVRLAYLEEGENGFKQLVEVAELMFGYNGDAERLCLAVGSPKDLGEFTGFGMQYGIGDNGVLYIEEADGQKELLRWEAWSPTTTLELEKLSRGTRLRAQERSHTITVVLAVLWATLSIVTVV
ncbi:hypothetical protein [Halolamina rubra]|uniref:hypothetical protein n=1 Tax=Halolamina rubra TaxID=1380430 RepID=UPI0012ABCA11|nr:hypothetical protein [Halolamina rubra]